MFNSVWPTLMEYRSCSLHLQASHCTMLYCTCDSELDHSTDLSLQAVGSHTGIVPCICPCHFGELQAASVLFHRRWDLTAVCRGRHKHTHTCLSYWDKNCGQPQPRTVAATGPTHSTTFWTALSLLYNNRIIQGIITLHNGDIIPTNTHRNLQNISLIWCIDINTLRSLQSHMVVKKCVQFKVLK